MNNTNSYWQNKLALWLHDPVHKMFHIQSHERRAQELAELLHVTLPDKNQYSQADQVASSLARASLPGYSSDAKQNGAVNFNESPILTHPLTGKDLRLPINGVDVDELHAAIKQLLVDDIGLGLEYEELCVLPEDERPFNGFYSFKDSPEEWAKALYFYLFFAFKKRLRIKDVGGLGGAWDVLPADSRMPDHPIWHHLALTSAVGSAQAQDEKRDLSLVVFAISPVQAFISKARKLRDHWAGSVLLSYLAFTGAKFVAEQLGPDHILYPSLHDQFLVEQWLARDFHLGRFLQETDKNLIRHQKTGKTIASFPNKFVFLCPKSNTKKFCRNIQQAIQQEWLDTANIVEGYLARLLDEKKQFSALFTHQVSDYWQFNYASCKLAGLDDTKALGRLLSQDKWQNEANVLKTFVQPFKPTGWNNARLYGGTHSLAQSALAAAKQKPSKLRKPQYGEKCPLCGEHEVLHSFSGSGQTSAKNYSTAVQEFWDTIRAKENSEGSHAQVGENERLCAVCAIKRFLPMALKKDKTCVSLLKPIFDGADTFPATTQVAAKRYLQRLTEKITISEVDLKELINLLHDSEMDTADDDDSQSVKQIVRMGKKHGIRREDRDKYYALLLMDGDKMGDLINGKTFSATWNDVLHPNLRKKFTDSSFHPEAPLRKATPDAGAILDQKRLINPALHAAVSEALNSFARYSVAPVINNFGGAPGRLIYAGGDDICAIMPLDGALQAAWEIQHAYSCDFVSYGETGAQALPEELTQSVSKIGMHLGKARKISISGAIVIAHEKTPLREVLRDAHTVLDGVAKDKAGRNAIAIRLKKRSGGDRDFWCQWEKPNLFSSRKETLFESLGHLMQGVSDEIMGGSLLYNMANLEGAIAPLAQNPEQLESNRKRIVQLIAYEVGHSGKLWGTPKEQKPQLIRDFSERLAGLMVTGPSSRPEWYNPEAAVIAKFLALPPQKDKEGSL